MGQLASREVADQCGSVEKALEVRTGHDALLDHPEVNY
jgi:hypothetical protein